MTRKENIIGIVPETPDPTAPPRQIVMQEIMRPEEMAMINTHHRLMWRINSIIAKVMHELFLAIGPLDVVSITGKQSDATAFQAVSEAFGSAGWFSLWVRHERPEDSIVLLVAQSPQVVIDTFEKELKLDRQQFIDNGWIPGTKTEGANSEASDRGRQEEGGKPNPPSKGAPERN